MAELNNPINAQNIIDRFADYVRDSANSGIDWGNDAKPFDEFDQDIFGGDISGKELGVNGTNLTPSTGRITAQTIFNVLLNETSAYTRIRKMRAQLFVTGAGGNVGRPLPGVVFDEEKVANMNNTYLQTIPSTTSRTGIFAGETITSNNLENYFLNLQTQYTSKREVSAGTFRVEVCHSSCHTSCCHGSRSRR